jgi:L-alanine-DL-glutamate epimerase-like enolase superfamily enzyme
MMDIQPFSVRLTTPLETARGQLRERSGFLVTIEHEGTTGVGEATPLSGWTESYEECENALARAEALADELDWGIALRKLDAPAARHGVALALADARAKREASPLYRSLGRDERVDHVPVNATIGTQASDPAEVAGLARDAVDVGYDCLKLKVGANGVEEDVERVRAVRNAVGEDVEIRADANGAWTPTAAERAFERLAALDVSYVEQPLPTAELSAYERLRASPVGVALDESLADRKSVV